MTESKFFYQNNLATDQIDNNVAEVLHVLQSAADALAAVGAAPDSINDIQDYSGPTDTPTLKL
jgi:hypothetical protein